jgi:hypothetical protein
VQMVSQAVFSFETAMCGDASVFRPSEGNRLT